jgi:hypothetical protein
MADDPQMEQAVALANRLWHEAGALCGAIVRALADDKITVFEGLGLGLHAVTLGSQLAETIAQGGPELHDHLLYVFEYSELVLQADVPLFRLPDAPPGA